MVFHGTQCMSIGFLMDGRSWMEDRWGENEKRPREREGQAAKKS